MKAHLDGKTSSLDPKADTEHEVFRKSFRDGNVEQAQLNAFGD